MSKATLLGICTQPKYNDDDVWQGADIMASSEVETPDRQSGVIGVHRVGLTITITQSMKTYINKYGYQREMDDYIMRRVKVCLDGMQRKFDGTYKDAHHIYEVIRLKMPRFISKSLDRCYYSNNLRTGEIFESKIRI